LCPPLVVLGRDSAYAYRGLRESSDGAAWPIPHVMSRARVLSSESGLTLVEVTVAMVILLVGVLGTVTMIDGANAVTSRTKAREGGTALARSVLEIARGIPYKEITSARVLDELESRAGLDDFKPGVTGHQISSRNFSYTVTATVCSMDDPKDNLGQHDESIVFCSNSDTWTSGVLDRNPDDYRRVAIHLSWEDNATHVDTVHQTGVVTNPVGGLGPSVTNLSPLTPNTTTITTAATENPSYSATTSATAAEVSWSINGSRLGQAAGSGTSWTFNWSIGPVNTPTFVDCTYVVQAEAFDDKGRAGSPNALVVTLNRRIPFAPPNFAGGRNLNGNRVDIQWDTNAECDIQRYEVYRGTSPASIDTHVCTTDLGEKTECVDEDAPAGQLYYQVLAVDKNASGADRAGDRSAALPIVEGNDEAPTTPTNFAVCTGGAIDVECNDIDGNLAPSGTAVLSWDAATDPDGIAFYRVYRDGSTYADRFDVLFPVAGKPLVFVDATSGPHTYRVSAVDSLFGESQLSGEVSWP